MSRHQIFAQQEVVMDSEYLTLFGKDDTTFTYNGVPVMGQGIIAIDNVGNTPNPKAATLVDGHLQLQPASATQPGVIIPGTQDIGGIKNFVTGINITDIATYNGSTIITEATLPPSESLVMGAPIPFNSNGAAIVDGVLTLAYGTSETPGIVSTDVQNISGAKTFEAILTANDEIHTKRNIVFETEEGSTEFTGCVLIDNERYITFANSFGNINTFVGQNAGVVNIGANSNTGIGRDAGGALVNGSNNTMLGSRAGQSVSTGNGSTLLGANAGNNLSTGSFVVAVGNDSGSNYTTEDYNLCIMNPGTEGDNATIRIGDTDMNEIYLGGDITCSRITSNAIFGPDAPTGLTTGQNNSFFGNAAGKNITDGWSNIIMGANSGSNFTGSESDNIIIGSPAVAADSGAIRIGGYNIEVAYKTYIQGIRGTTVTAGLAVEIDEFGQLGTVVSSKRYKSDIEDLKMEEAEKLYGISPKSFMIKKQRQTGVIAEEVESIFPDSVIKKANGDIHGFRYNDLHAYYITLLKAAKEDRDQQRAQLQELRQQFDTQQMDIETLKRKLL